VVYSDQASSDTQPAMEVDQGADGVAAVQANDAPPALPEGEQPPCPEEGYLWTPGYWAWAPGGYYWVPGTWVQPPRVGVLWTPAYWEFAGTVFVFHAGYWGPHIGYYGGVNYGFGYFGSGFVGGRWVENVFAYNRSVSNLGGHVFHSTYDEAVGNSVHSSKVSYNGGPGGTRSIPTAQERAFAAEAHFKPTALQRQTTIQAARLPVLMPHISTATASTSVPRASLAVAAAPKVAVYTSPPSVATHSESPLVARSVTPHPAASPQRTMRTTPTPAPTRTSPSSTRMTPNRSMPKFEH
jgi:hypothetical protein